MNPKKNDFWAIDLNYFSSKKEFFDQINSQDLSYTKAKDFLNDEKLRLEKQESSIAFIDSNKPNVGVIQIQGELVNRKDPCAAFFGFVQTTYSDIIVNLSKFENDSEIEKIILQIDSPGGTVAGVMDVVNKIKSIDKTIVTQGGALCCSAAYLIASQTDKIMANSRLSYMGSIGVMCSFVDNSQAMEKAGYKKIVITSTDAPDKYLDPSTDKGQLDIKKQLDEIHNVFVSEVSEGRQVSVADINVNFGKGGVLLAEKAKEVGMIDEVTIVTHVKSSNGDVELDSHLTDTSLNQIKKDTKKEDLKMDIEEFKGQHSDLYSEVFELGIKTERTRIEKLNVWVKTNPETQEIVERAISQGQSSDDVMPELLAVIKTGFGSNKSAKVESPQEIAQVAAKVAGDVEPEINDSDVEVAAKNAFASVIF